MDRQKQTILALIDKLNVANFSYYNTGKPIMDDAEYDRLLDELSDLEKETGYILTNSPTQHPGYIVANKLDTVTHDHPMLSLDKCHTPSEVCDFISGKQVLYSAKLDGLTVSATYENGELVKLETRGNGEEGKNIMIHANSFLNLPKHIDVKGTYVIDGECLITYKDFNNINNNLPKGEERYKNPRNLAAGSLNLLDSSESSTRRLRFVAWNVIQDENNENDFYQRLMTAEEYGFDIVPCIAPEVNTNSTDVTAYLHSIKAIAEDKDYPIDGVVITYRDVEYGKGLGRTAKHFRHSIAYKFEDEDVETKLTDIEWSLGRTGIITPVAHFEPVEIDGTIVSQASLHNVSIFKSLNLGLGDRVTVYKANLIIPQIRENLDIDKTENLFEIPCECPKCKGTAIIRQDVASEVLYCANPECNGQLLGKLNNFVSKDAMDIDGLSTATLQRFINLGIVNSFSDLYVLYQHRDKIECLDKMGKKSVDNLIKAIESSKHVPLNRFIRAFGIVNVGRTQSKLISDYFKGDREAFTKALDDNFDFTQINGIGEVINSSIYTWMDYNRDEYDRLCGIISIDTPTVDIAPEGFQTLSDKVFVVTGKVNHFNNRDALKAKIESLGGRVASSVTSKTNYLINNDVDSTTGKNKKAKELNIPIISEDEFLNMIK